MDLTATPIVYSNDIFDVASLAADLRRDEGVRQHPYVDTVGKVTIGVGRNLTDVGLSSREVEMLLSNDIGAVVANLDHALPWWRALSPARQRALANMAFNLGVNGLVSFHDMVAALETGRYDIAAREALDSRWAHQVGDRARRIAALFRGGRVG